jgi:hypothetical protein
MDGSDYGEPASPTPATVEIHHDLTHASYLEIPVVGRDPSEVTVCEAPQQPDAGVVDSSIADGQTDEPDSGTGGDGGDGQDGSVDTSSSPSGCSCRLAAPARTGETGSAHRSSTTPTPGALSALLIALAMVWLGARARKRRRNS